MSQITFRQALNDTLDQEMRRDEDVVVYGLDVTDHKCIFGSTAGLLERFGPRRIFTTPLAEDAMTGMGIGMAINGMRPIHIHIRVDFLLLAMNQLANMVATCRYMSNGKLTVPMTIRAVFGRGWGQGPQHSKTLHSVFGHIPGLKVVLPTTPMDAKGLLASAIRDDAPVIVLEHRWLYDITGEVPDGELTIPLNSARVVRKGDDVTVVAVSWMVIEAVKAARVLEQKHGVQVEVVDPRTIQPLDFETVQSSIHKTGRLLVADYDWLFCGFSAEVSALAAEHCLQRLKAPVRRLGFAHTPCPTTRPLENKFYADAVDIIRTIEEMMDLPPADLSDEDFYSYENKFKGPF